MNCKPGDMAYVAAEGVHRSDEKWAINHIVKCVSSLTEPSGLPAWVVDPPLVSPSGKRWEALRDFCLRPLANPGDDAADESTRWLPPVPTVTGNETRVKERA